jgi:hypothetical protein
VVVTPDPGPPRSQRIQRRELLAIGTVCYTGYLVFRVPPDGWMLGVWGAVAAVLVAVVTAAVVGQNLLAEGDPRPGVLHPLRRMIPAVTATACFAVIAVLAAALETRALPDRDMVYWLLGIGMVPVVLLYLSSYERGQQKAPWK